jgi:hypothetical protein
MDLAMESFARNSLAQFTQLYLELVAENGGDPDVSNDFERKMWTKITVGAPRGNRIPWSIIKKEIKIQLPYLPDVINYSRGCQALKKADGLYIPCGSKCVEETILCQSCTKTGAKYGQVEDRGMPGTYTDPEDKHEITYGTWLAKKEKTMEDVCSAINDAGFEFVIPTSYLAVNAKRIEAKRRPGRPGSKKDVEESDDESVTSSISSKSSKSNKPKAKKTKSDEEKPKAKPKKAKKAETDSEDEAPKKTKKAAKKDEEPKKTKKAAKKAETDSEDEAPKPKKATKKAAKAESDSEDEAPKKAEKPKAKPKKAAKAESDEDEAPKKTKAKPKKAAKSETDSEDEAPKPKAKKAAKTDSGNESDTSKSSKKTKAKAPEPDESQLAAEIFEEEANDEIIEIDGEKYKLRNGEMVFNMEGEWVGKIEDGEVMWRE